MSGVPHLLLFNLEAFEGRLGVVLQRDPSDKSSVSRRRNKELT